MTSTRQKIHASVVASTLLLMPAWVHAKPPPDVLGAAQKTLVQARAAGAQTYAPLELRFAEERLDQAQQAVGDRDYKVAASLADESAVNSELANIKARLGKLREAVDSLKEQNAEIERALPAATANDGGAR